MIHIRELSRAIRSALILWSIAAVIYPLIMLAIGQFILPWQANGSLLKDNRGIVIGSALIGQSFTSDRYFWSRPSVVDYSSGEKAPATGVSGASNFAPSNPELFKRIQAETNRLKQANIQPTADLVYTSGSGLDPHITIESGRNQIERIARSRGLNTNQVEILIPKYTEGRFLGIFGEPGVNVLKINLALDRLQNQS